MVQEGALLAMVEFKKLVYDSKFTKCAEEMSFVNYQGLPKPVM